MAVNCCLCKGEGKILDRWGVRGCITTRVYSLSECHLFTKRIAETNHESESLCECSLCTAEVHKYVSDCPLCAGNRKVSFPVWMAFSLLRRICFCTNCWGKGHSHSRGLIQDTSLPGFFHTVYCCYKCDGLGTWLIKKATR